MCLAIPGELLEILEGDALTRAGRVGFGGIVRRVALAFTPEARVGDYLLVHAGIAIAVLDAEAAARSLAALATLGEVEE